MSRLTPSAGRRYGGFSFVVAGPLHGCPCELLRRPVYDDDAKIASIPTFALRLQKPLRERLQTAADRNGQSLNSKIVARLTASFDLIPLLLHILGAPRDYEIARLAARHPACIVGVVPCDGDCGTAPSGLRNFLDVAGILMRRPTRFRAGNRGKVVSRSVTP